MQLNKIPTTVVTGFLGSGKTTLLSNVLKQAAGKRIAVIVNEFGELDIDSDLLRSCPLDCEDETATAADGDNGFYELANGCICCTVEEEFLPVMEQLVARRDDIDHILIETSVWRCLSHWYRPSTGRALKNTAPLMRLSR